MCGFFIMLGLVTSSLVAREGDFVDEEVEEEDYETDDSDEDD